MAWGDGVGPGVVWEQYLLTLTPISICGTTQWCELRVYFTDEMIFIRQSNRHPKRRVFFSFHYEADAWRAAQIRNAGVLEGNEPVSDNSWEQVKLGGDAAIRKWIDEQIATRSCVVVLIGAETANRKWVRYEIEKGWESGKGVVGIYVYNLKDRFGYSAYQGENPFERFTFKGMFASEFVKAYAPPTTDSQMAYRYITHNIERLVEEAIANRRRWG